MEDVCSAYEDLETKMKIFHLNNNVKRATVAEKWVHTCPANKFYAKRKIVLVLGREKKEVGGIMSAYMEYLSLPKIPVQEMFYLRKLWPYIFCIHDIKTNLAEFYIYHEDWVDRVVQWGFSRKASGTS